LEVLKGRDNLGAGIINWNVQMNNKRVGQEISVI
jgi:hypothetical protein